MSPQQFIHIKRETPPCPECGTVHVKKKKHTEEKK